MITQKNIELIEKEAQGFLNDNSCHDIEHTQRVLRLAVHIAKIENADQHIVRLAAILHDIGRKQQDESGGKICHAKIGAVMARDILKKYNIDMDTIDRICHCIERHRFRGGLAPESLEAKIIYDADKLDSIGAIGLGRAFQFSGELGAKLHNFDIDIEKTEAYSREDTAWREFEVKLKKIKDRIFTSEGKKIAQGRHDFMVNFFKRMEKEIKGEV